MVSMCIKRSEGRTADNSPVMYRLVATALLALSAYGRDLRSSREAIVGGVEVEISEVPHMAALLFKNQTYCGGSIIGDRHIVTAGHCINK